MLIKLSLAGQPENTDLSQYTGNSEGEIDGCKFIANDSSLRRADAWFVFEGTNLADTRCEVPKGQLHFGSAETSWKMDKYVGAPGREFLDQFDRVHSFLRTKHPRAKFASPFLPWMVNANHGTIFQPHNRDFWFFSELSVVEKTRPLSMFCSDNQWRPAHKLRFEFAKEVKRVFKDDVVWFGNGVNPVPEKWDGLAQFERTIVLENNNLRGVFSEKIFDPYLCLTLPVYNGDPQIRKSFPVHTSEIIDLTDFHGSLKKIAGLLNRPPTAFDQERLRLGKTDVLDRHHFLRRVCRLAKRNATRKKTEFVDKEITT